jgi:hypothetical protein
VRNFARSVQTMRKPAGVYSASQLRARIIYDWKPTDIVSLTELKCVSPKRQKEMVAQREAFLTTPSLLSMGHTKRPLGRALRRAAIRQDYRQTTETREIPCARS